MRHLLLALVVCCSQLQNARAGDNWPEFRGPTADGHSDARGLPVEWSEKNNVRWKTAIHGKGWSSPVIWGDQVWVTTAPEDGKTLHAVCVDKESGKIVHDLKVFDNPKPAFCHAFNSYASPTPAIEQGRVYVHFGSAGTACLDTATGKTLWERRDLPCDHFRGPGSSPILYKDFVILTFDGFDHQYVVALNKKDGKTAWKTDRDVDFGTTNGDLKKAYSTPRIIEVGGKPQLVSPAAVWTNVFNPDTGEELWRVKHGGMNVSARPLVGHGFVYLVSGYGNKLLALKPEGKGDVTTSHVAWTYNKGVPTRPSLLLVDDLIFFVSDDGVAGCVEARTGKEIKKLRLGGKYSASPLFADGRLYFFSQDGPAHVLEASRDMKELAKNELDNGFMASPAVSGKALFLRTTKHLYRIEK